MATRTTRAPARQNGNGAAVAVRDEEAQLPAQRAQHPLIGKLEDRMPQVVELLPAGMDGKRFKGVVFQALLKNRDLFDCTFESIFTSVREAAEAGLEPTGALGRAWLLPYNVNVGSRDNPRWEKHAQLIIGYRGYAELAWRADRVLFTIEAVREGDEFSYRRGTDPRLDHVPSDDPDREAADDNITHVYSIARFPDGRADFEVMSWAAVERIRDRAKRRNPVWATDAGEMAKKTVLRRHVKRLPLSPTVQRFLAGDEATDFETPVERIPAGAVQALPAGASRTDQASARAAALRGEVVDEPPAADDEGEAVEEAAAEPEPEPPPRRSRARQEEPEPPDDIPFEPTAEASTTPESDLESGPARGASAVTCPHDPNARVVHAAGVTCMDCGEILAHRDLDPAQLHPAKAPREALMARIHVGRTHEEAKALTARVLGIAGGEWSMAELLEEELQLVVDTIRDEDRRSDRPVRRRREPAAAGRRSR